MALEGFLSTDNLLTIIAVLTAGLNYQNNKIRGLFDSLTKYFTEDIAIRKDLKEQAEKVFDKLNKSDKI